MDDGWIRYINLNIFPLLNVIMSTKPFYQLTTKNGNPTFYTFFDNIEPDPSQRLHIRVMIYHLNSEEYRKTTTKINTCHGVQSIDDNEPLEFMKYTVIHWKGDIIVVDMDTLHYVTVAKDQSLSKHLMKRTPQQGEPLKRLKSKTKLQQGPSLHKGESSVSRAKLTFETQKHGDITVTWNTYADPNVRNGLSISVQKNVNKDSMYGACIYATHPKYLLLKNAHTLPAIPTSKKIKEMQNSKYWVVDDTPKKYMNKDNTDVIMIPRGKTVKHKR